MFRALIPTFANPRIQAALRSPLLAVCAAIAVASVCASLAHRHAWVMAVVLGVILVVGVVYPLLAVVACRLIGVSFSRARAVEGESIDVAMRVHNRGILPVLGLELGLIGGRWLAIEPLSPFGSGVTRASLSNLPRGPICRSLATPGASPSQPRLTLRCAFPFDLFTARRQATACLAGDINPIVWPRPQRPTGGLPPEVPSRAFLTRRAAPVVARCAMPGDDEPAGVRPHRHGDPLRRVHWQQTARHGRLIVRDAQRAADRQTAVLVIAASTGPAGCFEQALRVAAYVIDHWTGPNCRGRYDRIWLSVAGRVFDVSLGASITEARSRLMDALALAEPNDRTESPQALAASLRRAGALDAALRWLVSPEGLANAAVARLRGAARADWRVIAVECDATASMPVHHVGGGR